VDTIACFLHMEQAVQGKHTLFRVGCTDFPLTWSGYRPAFKLRCFKMWLIIRLCL